MAIAVLKNERILEQANFYDKDTQRTTDPCHLNEVTTVALKFVVTIVIFISLADIPPLVIAVSTEKEDRGVSRVVCIKCETGGREGIRPTYKLGACVFESTFPSSDGVT